MEMLNGVLHCFELNSNCGYIINFTMLVDHFVQSA